MGRRPLSAALVTSNAPRTGKSFDSRKNFEM
jgi:hypothetical protein